MVGDAGMRWEFSDRNSSAGRTLLRNSTTNGASATASASSSRSARRTRPAMLTPDLPAHQPAAPQQEDRGDDHAGDQQQPRGRRGIGDVEVTQALLVDPEGQRVGREARAAEG